MFAQRLSSIGAGLFFDTTDKLSIIEHAFDGSFAMTATRRFPEKLKLVLIETNPFYLLADHSQNEAYQEAELLCHTIKMNGASGDWEKAAAFFADYWNVSCA